MLVIGIAGGTGSGKTTVARRLLKRIGTEHVALISQDSYYKHQPHLTKEERAQVNYDHPNSFDNELLIEHLQALRRGESIRVPVYSFSEHIRTDKTIALAPTPVVVLEGILVLADEPLRKEMDIKVFVDTDADVRVLRRINRDMRERGRTFDSVFAQYLNTVKPMHEAFIEPSKRYADLIVPEGGENEIAVTLLASRIEQSISQ
ncbi:uridine kinase [Paenibacillus sp. YN15]|uniref:uridine kinase n=1 Tax=Paenibacillus sp. YN15 TaxID=1742774 RepID=UPI000DCBA448|nr:uridine kinase [Paenibacillus sp. YN15]RAV05658.1 uridine kinase [Paenibacillus sp. YN15]